MRCANCKNRNADSYQRIVEGDVLFETFQKMDPHNRGRNNRNSYYCGDCVRLADNNFKQNQRLIISNQNVHSVMSITTSSSQTLNERSMSNQVVNKRLGDKENDQPGNRNNRPGPASSKRRSKSSKRTASVSEKSSSQESLPENLLLLNVASSSQSSQEVADLPSQEVVASPKRSTAQNPNPSPTLSAERSMRNQVVNKGLGDKEKGKPRNRNNRPGPASSKERSKSSNRSVSIGEKSSSQESVPENLLLNVASLSQNSQEVADLPSQEAVASPNPNSSHSLSVESTSNTKIRVVNKRVGDKESDQPGSKRNKPGNRNNRPGPASIKRRNKSSNRTVTVGEMTSSQESEPEDDNLPHSVPSQEVVALPKRSTAQNPNPSHSLSAESNQSHDLLQSIAGPSAPVVQNPRIRQERSRMSDDIRNFFQQGGQGQPIDVNNYSRTLAG